MNVLTFDDNELLVNQFAHTLQAILSDAIVKRGVAYLVVSGGKTPITLFKRLAHVSLPWEKVVITLADERCLPPTHPDSNAHLVYTYLLTYEASHAQFINLFDKEKIAALPQFDVVILGMGEDGHTASIFPCSEGHQQALAADNAEPLWTLTPKQAPYERITMTKWRLLNTRTLFLHIQGSKKWEVLQQAKQNELASHYPISHFLEHPAMTVFYSA